MNLKESVKMKSKNPSRQNILNFNQAKVKLDAAYKEEQQVFKRL